MEAEIAVDCSCVTGECPRWHVTEQCLYWVDIPRGQVLRLDPRTGGTDTFDVGGAVGGFTFQAGGGLLLFMARGRVQAWRNGALAETVIESLPELLDSRFNDVCADPEGRVYCGTVTSPSHAARLYRLDRDGSITQLLDGIGTANGIGFTPDLRRMYFTDTRKREIYLFDYDQATGAIGNQQVFARIPDGEGRPDGLAVDTEGCIWSARWDGGCVVRYDPDGAPLLRLALPARRVSAVAFGGPELSDLYITTAGGDNRQEFGPGAGALFRARPGVRGRPENWSRIRT
jgi:D-xylono/L-arabinono-1,4-lactonase